MAEMSAPHPLLTGLNERQAEAVTLGNESAIVLAGAGSGKTKVLTTRIAWLLANGRATPESVLAVTFTNKAAKEMKGRLSKLVANFVPGGIGKMWVGTFHGLCHRMLRENAKAAGLPASFSIMDEQDQLALVKRVMKQGNVNSDIYPPGQLQAFINKQKEAGVRPGRVSPKSEHENFMAQFYGAYEAFCAREGVIDFAELLLRVQELFETNNEVLDRYRSRFSHILVDEFQDTNPIQYKWLLALKGPAATVFGVGDDDQSVYSFRLADPRNMQHFVAEVAKGKVIKLEQNYRSTGAILNAANNLIQNNQSRLGKNLWTQAGEGARVRVREFASDLDEADHVAEELKRFISAGVSPREMAILYRSNAQSRAYEKALMTRGIPYVIYGGLRFYDRMEIKNVLAYMRLTTNINDNGAFLRVVNFPPRGIGERSIDAIKELAEAKGIPLFEAAATEYDGGAKARVDVFLDVVGNLFDAVGKLPLPEYIDYVIRSTGLLAQYEKKLEDADRVSNLKEMVSAAVQFCADSDTPDAATRPAIELLDDFLATATLESAADKGNESDNAKGRQDPRAVTLMTVHASKGLEFEAVFLGGVEENLFPHAMSLAEGNEEEERRLMYVAITRAKRHCLVTYAKQRMLYGQMQENPPSRFVKEVPPELLDFKTMPGGGRLGRAFPPGARPPLRN